MHNGYAKFGCPLDIKLGMCIDEHIYIGMFLQIQKTHMSFFTNIQLIDIILNI